MLEWLRALLIVVQHPQEHLAHAPPTVHVSVLRRLTLGAPAYTVDIYLLEGSHLLPRFTSSSREQLERMGYARSCCLKGALAAPLRRVVFMKNHNTCVELQPLPQLERPLLQLSHHHEHHRRRSPPSPCRVEVASPSLEFSNSRILEFSNSAIFMSSQRDEERTNGGESDRRMNKR